MLWRIAAFAALGGFLFGYDLGVMGGALLGISDEFATTEWTDGLIVGAAKFGACFGAFLGGALMLHYGRRKAITIDSLLFMAGPIVMASAHGATALVVGRLLVGLGIGVSAVVVPAYLGEVAPPKSRGCLVELYEVLLCIGMLMALIVDWQLSSLPSAWRWMLAVPLVPALIMSAALFAIPESPRWLVVSGRLDEALAVLHRTFAAALPDGSRTIVEEAEQELLELWSGVEKDKAALRQRSRGWLCHSGAKQDVKVTNVRKHSWQAISSAESDSMQGVDRGAFPTLRRTPVRTLPTHDRTPPLLPLLGMAKGMRSKRCDIPASPAAANALPPSTRTSPSDSPRRRTSTATSAASTASRRVHSSGEGHAHGSGSGRHAMKGLRLSASGPSLHTMHTSASPASSAVVHHSEGHAVQQQLSANGTEDSHEGDQSSAVQQSPMPTQPSKPPRERRRKQRWQNYGEATDSSSGGESSPQPAQMPTQWGLAVDCAPAASVPGEAGSVAPLETAPSRALTVRTDCGDTPSSHATASPVLWFDGQGTPQFHQSLKLVPAGLTPIRTRSEDIEVGGRTQAAWRKAAKRQQQRARKLPERSGKLPRNGSSGAPGEPSSLPASESPSFPSTLVAMMADIVCVARGKESSAFGIAIWLAFFNQACASTAIINYAPQLLHKAGGLQNSDSILFSSFVSASKVVGVVTAMLLIDRLGRRPLLLVGSAVTTIAMTVLAMSDTAHSAALVLAAMCAFVVAFSASWAGVFWVLMSEMFSMSVKSPAVSAATAALFLTGAVTDFLFLALHRMFGGGTFLLYAAVSAAGGIYVYRHLPETRGRNLEEVQALIASLHQRNDVPASDTNIQLTRWRADIP